MRRLSNDNFDREHITNQLEYGGGDWCTAVVGAAVAETLQRPLAENHLADYRGAAGNPFLTGTAPDSGAAGYGLAVSASMAERANFCQW